MHMCGVALQAATQADSPTPEDFAALCADVAAGRFQELLQLDQLRREQAAGRVFAGFSEGTIGFAPTFKVTSASTTISATSGQSQHRKGSSS